LISDRRRGADEGAVTGVDEGVVTGAVDVVVFWLRADELLPP